MEKITTGTVSIGREEINNVVSALKDGMLSTGDYLHQFEKSFPGFYGKDYGVMVNSGQSALEVPLEFLCRDEPKIIAVPALTYMATIWSAHRLRNNNGQLAFFDVKIRDYGIDFGQPGFTEDGFSIEPEKVDIVIPVDLFGKCCDFERVSSNQIVIEDACEAAGNSECRYGDYIAFSFYASHIMSVGGGGMVVFNGKEANDFIRSYIAHGRSHSGDFTKHTDIFMDRFIFDRYGQSLRSDNIHAAIAVAQYAKVLDIVAARRDNAARMSKNLEEIWNKRIGRLPDQRSNVFQFYPILFDGSDLNILSLMDFLFKNNIDSRRCMPVITQPSFQYEFPALEPEMFPQSLLCGEKGLLLGCHQNMTYDQVDYMCEKILTFFKIRREL